MEGAVCACLQIFLVAGLPPAAESEERTSREEVDPRSSIIYKLQLNCDVNELRR